MVHAAGRYATRNGVYVPMMSRKITPWSQMLSRCFQSGLCTPWGEGGRRVRRHEREGVQAAGHRDGPVGTARQQGDPAGHAEHHPGGVRERVGEFLMMIAGRMRSGAVHDVRETGGCNERSAGC